ncbi:ApbE family lipoprotein [Tepidanaerobacter acetatoxydans Re1]|uniref:ApbE family lipoprotein n=1 Tax=Tepidanaerobacter acetatoxydans (strain DSM 21804 / JCM 16047 / Re1) TaxID=1209989 RepID=F4LUP9_TEPAE|nr:thiamine biosynthesis protein ApbE [Tepidanaerobacter acetatoxydans]AEE90617.1 ApbE family lipoprotein [Tepidanaerobacter acetatoxydans Re1]CCP25140.1 ApbE family lipoprotein [Tepidanaerobacter acetatoxydans Re1]
MMNQLEDGRVFLEYGPIRMLMDVSIKVQRQPELAFMVGLDVIEEFKRACEYMSLIKGQDRVRESVQNYPISVQKMLAAVKRVGDETLTPLAAVAGAFSDIALEKALALGAERVIINNGGDIAFKDIRGNPIKIGIPVSKNSPTPFLTLMISDKNVTGICTSGIGGRSFTKGIATAAVAIAENATLADACATYLGNETNVEDPEIIRCYAEEIDSETDIPGHQITLKVGCLSKKKIYSALLNGMKAAEDIYERHIIWGSILCIDKEIVTVPSEINIS